jgi:hypothetical protein
VVVRLAHQQGSGCVVVSSDREIRRAVEKFGATAIYAGEFNAILNSLDGAGFEDADDDALAASQNRRLSPAERRRREKLAKLRL